MQKLILVRHSLPEIVPDVPASRWHLAETGRERCKLLAQKLVAHDLDVIVASLEPKATETGRIVADILGKPFETAANLHEHERNNVRPFATQEQFEEQIATFFANPRRRVFGSETADDADHRFSQAVADLIATNPGSNVAIVSHGTVMTLFITRAAGIEPFPFWKRLGLPAFVVLSVPGLRLLTDIENVE